MNILFEATPIDPSTGLPVTVRLAHIAALSDSTQVNGLEWDACIQNFPSRSISNIISNGKVQSVSTDYGALSISLFGANSYLSRLVWDGALGRTWVGPNGAPFSFYVQKFEGKLGAHSRDENTLKIPLYGRDFGLNETNILTGTYSGTGNANGTVSLLGTYKPKAYGSCRYVTPVKIDPAYVIYQVHDGAVTDIPAVYESGIAINSPTNAPVASVSTYAQLKALTLNPGEWAEALPVGLFRLGSEPSGKLTADVIGDTGAGTTLASITIALLQAAGLTASDYDATSINAIGSSKAWNLYLTDQATVGAITKAAYASAGAYLFSDELGDVRAGSWISNSGTLKTVSSVAGSDYFIAPGSLKQEEASPMNYSVKINAEKCWSVHSDADISPAIAELQEGQAALEAEAAAAQADADAAQADATASLLRLNNMALDSKLTREEKNLLRGTVIGIQTEYPVWCSRADALTISRTAYDTKYNALINYLNALTPPYNDTSADTAINAAAFDLKFTDYYTQRQTLANAISAEDAKRATWVQVSDPTGTKPTDNATPNAPGDHLVPNANMSIPNDTSLPLANWFIQNYPGTVTRATGGSLGTDVYCAVLNGSTAIQSRPTVPVTAGETLYWRVVYRLVRGRLGTVNASDTAQIWALIRYYDSTGTEMFGQDANIIPNIARSPTAAIQAPITGTTVVPSGARTARAYFTLDIAPIPGTPSQAQAYCLSIDFDRSAWGATVGAQSGNNFYAADGTTLLNDAAIITAQGQAATIANQKDWATYSGITTTNMANRVQYLNGTSGYFVSQRAMPTNILTGLTNNVSAVPTAADQGGGTGVTITIPAHTRSFAGSSGTETISYNAGSITNLAYSTLYFVYCDDPLRAGGAVTYAAITNPTNMVRIDRLWIRTITTPASGGGPTSGGGGGGGGYCVEASSHMPHCGVARDVAAGDEILALDYTTFETTRLFDVEANQPALERCVKLVSDSGITLVASRSTPVTLRSGEMISIMDCAGRELPVQDANGFRWEKITWIVDVGMRAVSRISCHGATYAAGEKPGRYIFTHNPAKP